MSLALLAARRILRSGSAWKPLRGPVRDWPLALCDASTINAHEDLVACDRVFTDFCAETYQVHYSPQQQWYYLSDQMPNEILLFRAADSCSGLGPGESSDLYDLACVDDTRTGVAHAAFRNPNASSVDSPRESIEARFFVFFSDFFK